MWWWRTAATAVPLLAPCFRSHVVRCAEADWQPEKEVSPSPAASVELPVTGTPVKHSAGGVVQLPEEVQS